MIYISYIYIYILCIHIYIYIYHDTKLSTEYWNLKMKQLNPQISWKIKGIYKSYNPTSKRCKLCLTEKLEILDDPDKNLLNKRSEIISQCRHNNKYRLKTLASSMKSGDITLHGNDFVTSVERVVIKMKILN